MFSFEDLNEDQLNDLSEEAPPEYICPITMILMKNPVVMPDGQTYEYEAIKRALSMNPTSPITRQPMNINQANKNYAIKNLIEKYVKEKMAQNKELNENIAKLTALGFDYKSSKEALKKSNNNIQNALKLLVNEKETENSSNEDNFINNKASHNNFNNNKASHNNINNNKASHINFNNNKASHINNNNNFINDDDDFSDDNNSNFINDDDDDFSVDNDSNFINDNVYRNRNYINNNVRHNNFNSDDMIDEDENEVINYKRYRSYEYTESIISILNNCFSILFKILMYLLGLSVGCLVIFGIYKLILITGSSISINLRSIFGSIKQAIHSFLNNSWNWIVNLFKIDDNIDENSSLFSKIKYYIVVYFKFIIGMMVSFLSNLYSAAFKIWPHIINYICLFFHKIAEIITFIVTNIYNFEKMIFTNIYHFVTVSIPNFFSNGKNVLDVIKKVFEKIVNVVAYIYSLIYRYINFVYRKLYNLYNFVISLIQNLIQWMT